MTNALSLIPVIGAIVCFSFASMLIRQYQDRKGAFQLMWGIALVLFGLGFIGEFMGLLLGWNQFSAKMYYFFGGILAVGYLSMGTMYLLKPGPAKWISAISVFLIMLLWIPIFGIKLFDSNLPIAMIILAVYLLTIIGIFFVSPARTILFALVAVTLLTAGGLISHTIDLDLLAKSESWREVMTIPLRSGAFALSSAGTFIIVIGAIYSAVTGWSDEKRRPQINNTIIIAVGVLIAALGGTLHGIFDIGKQLGLSLSTTLGISVMLVGYLRSRRKK